MAVIFPEMNSYVDFPLEISIIVDNSKLASLGCSWGVFEGQAGTVKIVDYNDNELGRANLMTKDQNWIENLIASLPVSFGTVLNLVKKPTTENLNLIFIEDNAEGRDNPDSLVIPVLIHLEI